MKKIAFAARLVASFFYVAARVFVSVLAVALDCWANWLIEFLHWSEFMDPRKKD